MQLTSIDLAADPGAWAAAGFAVAEDAVTLGAVRVHLRGADAGRGLLGWSFATPPSGSLDGLPEPSAAPAPGPGGQAHPNGITAVDHVVAFSPDLERTVAALEAVGMDLRRRREGPTGAGSARQAFFRVGEAILEVVEHPPQAREAGDARGAGAALGPGAAHARHRGDRRRRGRADRRAQGRDPARPADRHLHARRGAGRRGRRDPVRLD